MSNYTAIITGGSKGIGADLASRLIDKDYTVVSISRNAPDWTHPKLHSIEADLLDESAVKQAGEYIAANHDVTPSGA